MIFLRLLAFMAGGFVLFAAPVLLLGQHLGPAAFAASAMAAALFAGGYFFFAIQGPRLTRSARLHSIGAALVAYQLIAGALVLTVGRQAQAAIWLAPLLVYSVCLLMAFIWPGELGRKQQVMRPRERNDNVDPYLQG